MKASVRARMLGIALLVPASCWAGFLNSVVKQVSGVNTHLAAQVAEVAHAPLNPAVPAHPATLPPSPAPAEKSVVTPAQRDQLLQSIAKLTEDSAKNAARVGAIVLTFVIAAIALGLSASIAGFVKLSTAAGVLSILATTAVGANNALPFRQEANNYKYVAAEAGALLTRARLDLQMTQDSYTSYLNKLTTLATYGDGTSVAGSENDLEKLLQELHATPGSA